MILYHITHRDNLLSILQRGLDPSYSKGVRKSVWGVTPSMVTWAIVHVLSKPQHRGMHLSDFIVIAFRVNRSQVSRYRRRIWYTKPGTGCVRVDESCLIPLAAFGSVVTPV
jgi:hypothetical protein